MPITIVRIGKLDDLKGLRSEEDEIVANGERAIFLALEQRELKVLIRTNFGELSSGVPTVASIPLNVIGFKDEGIIFPKVKEGVFYQKYTPGMGDFVSLKEGDYYEAVLKEAQK